MSDRLTERLRDEAERYAPPAARVMLEAADALEQPCADCAALRAERDEAQLALGEAAREINVAGPVAHRIRVLRGQYSREMEHCTLQRDEARAGCAALREALLKLAALWDAGSAYEVEDMGNTQYASGLQQCADELRAALARSQPDGTPEDR